MNGVGKMDRDLVLRGLEAVQQGDGAAALDLLKEMIASAAGGASDDAPASLSETDGDEAGAESDGAEGVPAPKRKKLSAEDRAASRLLTPSERRACRAQGCAPAAFLKLKSARGRS